MGLVEIVKDAWGFTGLVPARVADVNAFGNLLVEDADGRTWRICPEELSCEIVATTPQEIEKMRPYYEAATKGQGTASIPPAAPDREPSRRPVPGARSPGALPGGSARGWACRRPSSTAKAYRAVRLARPQGGSE